MAGRVRMKGCESGPDRGPRRGLVRSRKHGPGDRNRRSMERREAGALSKGHAAPKRGYLRNATWRSIPSFSEGHETTAHPAP